MANRNEACQVLRMGYKRPFDLSVIVAACVLFLPFWLILCMAIPLAIRLEDGGRVFYVQRRVGRDGRHFRLFKFRTMMENAEGETGPVWAAKQDPRLTRVGRVLRRFHLDEMPQLFNVLRGDMSLVGPRPERPELLERIQRDVPAFAQRLRVSPGLAGLAQIQVGYHADPQTKLRYDKLYMDTMSPLLDFKLLLLGLRYAFVKPLRVKASAEEARPMHWLYGIAELEAAIGRESSANGASAVEPAAANGWSSLANGAPKKESAKPNQALP